MNRILDVRGDIIETFHHDQMTGISTVKKTQDVEGYLDRNARERSNQVSGWKGDMHKVASIPLILVEQWSKEVGCDILKPQNRHFLMAKIKDRDYSKLRTKEGKI